ncbi:hypothetical protein QBC40DRAFT_248745 [Triangularia verruculosa]|uniref:Uncharacterized protein n=1 Tax=Triangularia verruculosa TaxID=2587418 RepID=A0AAN7B0R1_9PEZI|nr:hypothetical protein QBC40DRAFT_248745 [Triangularia verruculosa]
MASPVYLPEQLGVESAGSTETFAIPTMGVAPDDAVDNGDENNDDGSLFGGSDDGIDYEQLFGQEEAVIEPAATDHGNHQNIGTLTLPSEPISPYAQLLASLGDPAAIFNNHHAVHTTNGHGDAPNQRKRKISNPSTLRVKKDKRSRQSASEPPSLETTLEHAIHVAVDLMMNEAKSTTTAFGQALQNPIQNPQMIHRYSQQLLNTGRKTLAANADIVGHEKVYTWASLQSLQVILKQCTTVGQMMGEPLLVGPLQNPGNEVARTLAESAMKERHNQAMKGLEPWLTQINKQPFALQPPSTGHASFVAAVPPAAQSPIPPPATVPATAPVIIG